MNYEQVETFLAITTYGSLTHAAKQLFVTQSTISTRIASLEKELNTTLIVRQKGVRQVALTAAGSAFIPLAQQWMSLFKESLNLPTTNQTILKIASVDAINNIILPDFFNHYATTNSPIHLDLSTHHSKEIIQQIENNLIDLGLTFSDIHYGNVSSQPLYTDDFVLLANKNNDYPPTVNCDQLPAQKEVFLNWSVSFNQWHHRHIQTHNLPLIKVNTGAMLPHYLVIKNSWAIVPYTIAVALATHYPVTIHQLNDAPEKLKCFAVSNKYPKTSTKVAVKQFKQKLIAYIAKFVVHTSQN